MKLRLFFQKKRSREILPPWRLRSLKLLILSFGIIPILAITLMGATDPGCYFTMPDPVGDEQGYGTYQYPTNIAFQPYKGLFDIEKFQVTAGPKGMIFFDTTFGKITNPWAAPEGYIHQNLRIFIDSLPEQGRTDLSETGAYVRFNPKYAWDVCLRIVGWGNSQLILAEKTGKVSYQPLETSVLGDGQTIRAVVPENLIGKPGKNWHYYVMVGSYDGFGEDFFRKVAPKPGEWMIGGGTGFDREPRLFDILAVEKGRTNQAAQLRSFDRATGNMAELYPVGQDLGRFNFGLWLIGFLGFLCLVILIAMVIKKPRSFSWFWVKPQPKTPVASK